MTLRGWYSHSLNLPSRGEMTLHMAGRKVYLSLVSLYRTVLRTDLGLMGTRLGKGSPKDEPVLKRITQP